MISKTLPLRKIISSEFHPIYQLDNYTIIKPHTRKVVTIKDLDGNLIATAIESQLGQYIATFDACEKWGYWYINDVIQPAQSNGSPFWLGNYYSISANTISTNNLTSVSSSLQSLSSTVIRFSDNTYMTTAPKGTSGNEFTILPVISGGTNASSFSSNNKFISFDGTRIVSTTSDQNTLFSITSARLVGGQPQNTYFVSPNWTNQKSPFFNSVCGALSAAVENSLIIVFPGCYQGQILLRNKVNIHCFPGVTLTYTTSGMESNGFGGFLYQAVITDYAAGISEGISITATVKATSAVTCVISGEANITKDDLFYNIQNSHSGAISISMSASNVEIHANHVGGNAWSTFEVWKILPGLPSPSASLYCDTLTSYGNSFFLADCWSAYQFLETREVISRNFNANTTWYLADFISISQSIYTDRSPSNQVIRIKDRIFSVSNVGDNGQFPPLQRYYNKPVFRTIGDSYGSVFSDSASTQNVQGNVVSLNGFMSKVQGFQRLNDGYYQRIVVGVSQPDGHGFEFYDSTRAIYKNISYATNYDSPYSLYAKESASAYVYGAMSSTKPPNLEVICGYIQVDNDVTIDKILYHQD